MKQSIYIRDGLLWLVAQLEHKQFELGLAQMADEDDAEAVAATEGGVA